MSADNGIYILKTKDGQYRITHAQAIENIYEDWNCNRYNPFWVVITWGACRYTRNSETAFDIANKMESRMYTEYGIRVYEYKKTWKHIVEDAKIIAEKYPVDSWERKSFDNILALHKLT